MATTTPEDDTKPGGAKKMIILGVVMALMAAGFYLFFAKSGDDTHAEPEPGEVLTLEPVHVNLAGGGYLKVGVALLMSADAGGHGEPNGAMALDLVISEFSQADPTEVSQNREEMKKSLEKKIAKAYHDEVLHIYFTEYVTQ